jgi:hypothetical protein
MCRLLKYINKLHNYTTPIRAGIVNNLLQNMNDNNDTYIWYYEHTNDVHKLTAYWIQDDEQYKFVNEDETVYILKDGYPLSCDEFVELVKKD